MSDWMSDEDLSRSIPSVDASDVSPETLALLFGEFAPIAPAAIVSHQALMIEHTDVVPWPEPPPPAIPRLWRFRMLWPPYRRRFDAAVQAWGVDWIEWDEAGRPETREVLIRTFIPRARLVEGDGVIRVTPVMGGEDG